MTTTTTRPGPANSITSEEGMRWYVFGEGDTEERYVSVTTALGLVDKEGLRRWATLLSADAALDQLPRLIKATLTAECGNTWKRCTHDHRVTCSTCPCSNCLPCVRRWVANRHYYESRRRADEGARLHDVAEHWVLHDGEILAHDEDIAAYVKSWQEWIADYGLTPGSWEMTEATVISREYSYAGTLDGIVTVGSTASPAAAELVAKVYGLPLSAVVDEPRAVRLIVDFKTREKPEPRLYPEHALQQAAYRNAEVVRLPDGTEVPLPATDAAVIVQVRPDGYLCQPVVTDDRTFGAFLSELAYARWHFEYATASVSPLSFKVPAEPKPAKRATKAAATKPSAVDPSSPMRQTTAAPRKRATKVTAEEPVNKPIKTVKAPLLDGDRPDIRRVAAEQAATLRRVNEKAAAAPDLLGALAASFQRPGKEPHPDSPYNDEIPF